MPLPLLIGGLAAAAGFGGIGAGIHGGIKMKKAHDTVKEAQKRNDENILKLENVNKQTMTVMDFLGEQEMKILSSFQRFSIIYERIHNAPEFHEINKDGVELSTFTPQEVKDASVGASVLLGGLGGATAGTAGGLAAVAGTKAAVMALGTASTGTAISALKGAAATNATLAALGGGSLATGGGGMALGSVILGGATLGAGLLIGGIIFNITGSKISEKADKAYQQMKENEEKINLICEYLKTLEDIANLFSDALKKVNNVYEKHLLKLENIVKGHYKKKFFLSRIFSKKCNFKKFTMDEKLVTENTILLVGLLYDMCKVQLVEKSNNKEELSTINEREVNEKILKSEDILKDISSVA